MKDMEKINEAADKIFSLANMSPEKLSFNAIKEILAAYFQQTQNNVWVKASEPTYCISINGVAVRIENISDCFDVILDDNAVMLQISKVDGIYKVTNAIDGWGKNCRNNYENAVVKLYIEIDEAPQQTISEEEIEALAEKEYSYKSSGTYWEWRRDAFIAGFKAAINYKK